MAFQSKKLNLFPPIYLLPQTSSSFKCSLVPYGTPNVVQFEDLSLHQLSDRWETSNSKKPSKGKQQRAAGIWLGLTREEPLPALLRQTHSKCHLPSSHHAPSTTRWLHYSSSVGKDVSGAGNPKEEQTKPVGIEETTTFPVDWHLHARLEAQTVLSAARTPTNYY